MKTKHTELALVKFMAHNLAKVAKPGRLKNQVNAILKIIDQELIRMPGIAMEDKIEMEGKISEWGKLTGWNGKPRHTATAVSFVLALLEASKYKYEPRLFEKLANVFDYFERKEGVKNLCLESGRIAFEKWERVMEGGECSK